MSVQGDIDYDNRKTKKYPRVNGEKLDPISRKRFEELEDAFRNYLKIDADQGWSTEVLAYNLAFIMLDT